MRRWATPLAHGALVSVVVAALVHLSVVLALPFRSQTGAWNRVASLSGGLLQTTGSVAATAGLPYRDPALADAACRYDLRGGPVSASLALSTSAFAALSVQSRQGRVLYGLTSRSATQNRLTLVILTAAQAVAARTARPAAGSVPDIQVVTDEPDGFVYAQMLASGPSEAPGAAKVVAGLRCRAWPAP